MWDLTDLQASIAFHEALGFEQNLRFSDDGGACMVWSEALYTMLLTHAKWATFTDRPLPPEGATGVMLSLSLDSREAVDAMNLAAVAHGGAGGREPSAGVGVHVWAGSGGSGWEFVGAFWMDPVTVAGGERQG